MKQNIFKNRNWLIVAIIIILLVPILYIIFNNFSNPFIKNRKVSILNEEITLIRNLHSKIAESPDNQKKEIESLLQQDLDPIRRGSYYTGLSYYYILNNDYVNHKKYSQMAISEYEKAEDTELLIMKIYTYMMQMAADFNYIEDTLSYCYTLYDILSEDYIKYAPKDLLTEAEIYTNLTLTIIYSNAGLIDKANYFFVKLPTYQEIDNYPDNIKSRLYFVKTIYYSSTKTYSLALKNSISLYELIKKTNPNTADIYQINIAQSYIGLGDADNALPHLEAATKYIEDKNLHNNLTLSYVNYAGYYILKGDYDKGLSYYTKAYNVSKEQNDYISCRDIIKHIYNLKTNYDTNIDISLYEEDFLKLYSNSNAINNELLSLASAMVDINDNMHNLREEQLKKESTLTNTLLAFVICSLIILICIIISLTVIQKKLKAEIIRRENSEYKLKELMKIDYLTKCYTKSSGLQLIDELVTTKSHFHLAILDIDNFKKVNDTYGHILGDSVLSKVSSILLNNITGLGSVIRFGGEEFIVILNNSSREKALDVLDGLRKEIASTIIDNTLSVTISIGVCTYINETPKGLIDKADKLLYKAKHNGKNQIQY